MELPDWAHFCERCGARVGASARHGDPLDQVEMGEAPAEPLWEDDVVPREEPSPSPDGPSVSPQEESADDQTQLMDATEMADAAGDLTVAMAVPEEADDDEDFPEPDEDAPESHEGASGESVGEAVEADDAEDATDEEAPDEADAASPEMTEAIDMDRELADDEDELSGDEDDAEEVEPAQPEPDQYDRVPVYVMERIDVGDDDGPRDDEPYESPYLSNPWEGRSRPSERLSQRRRGSASMVVGAVIAAVAIAVGLLVARFVIGGGADTSQQDEQVSLGIPVTTSEAKGIIEGLEGWWKTDRTFDGRYWHITDGQMEVYAADGVLASQTAIDPTSIERLSVGPGGIEGPGYYLRSIAFFLRDDDDTLYAVDSDGSADEDANLHRVDAPGFSSDGEEAPEDEESTQEGSEEYVLPDSSERAYETWELEGLSDYDLFVARNEIYARHGYVFEGQLSEYFAGKSWYTPSDTFNEGDISQVERENVGTILAIEQARGSQYL